MQPELQDAELETYARQIVLEEIGYDGQLKLRNARACVIGMGGLGTLIAQKLTGMGIGYLRIVDRDIVSRSDLHRQFLYDADTVGLPKVEVALRRLKRLNPDVEIDPIPESLSSVNKDRLISDMDVILDGLDNPEPRYLINRACHEFKIPYVFGGGIEVHGNVSTIVPGRTACLECFMPGLKNDDLPKCGVVGVHPSALAMVTAVQVFEAVRLLIGKDPKLLNKLLFIDLEEMGFQLVTMQPLKNCPVCGRTPDGLPAPVEDTFFEETCARDGRKTFVINPIEGIEVNLDDLRDLLSEKGLAIQTAGIFGVTFVLSDEVFISVLKSGTTIFQIAPHVNDYSKNKVMQIYTSILVDGLKFPHSILPQNSSWSRA